MTGRKYAFAFALFACLGGTAYSTDELLDVTDSGAVHARRPLLIAHRGGVVSEDVPECSLGAIQAAAEADYDMVELDVRQSSDGVPVVFHDPNLKAACGIDGEVKVFTAEQLRNTSYLRGTAQKVIDLETALRECRARNLGVMLDVKQADEACLERVVELVRQHKLERSTIAISGDPTVQRIVAPVSMLRITEWDPDMIADLPPDAFKGQFWFGLPQNLPSAHVPLLQSKGALVFPAINTFRYRGNPDPEAPRKDVERLKAAGADGFQIDSVYQELFE